MTSLGERIKKLRRSLDLTQQGFGERIGVKQNTIALIESGKRNTSDQLLLSICREFSVNEPWLRTGEGAMFVKAPNTAIKQLSEEFYLDSFDEALVEEYLHLSPNQRKTFRTFFYRVLMKSIGGSKPDELLEVETGYPTPDDIEAFGEEAKKLAIQQFSSEKKPDALVSSVKESDAV